MRITLTIALSTMSAADWKQVRDTKPEALGMYRAATCNNMN